MPRNQERTAPWHKDHTIQTVWPYLDKLQQRVTKLVRAVSAGQGGSGSYAALAGQPGRVTQQINFTAYLATAGEYIARDDAGTVLGSAALLYRARGGEIIRSLILSQPASSNGAWEIEIRQGYYTRSTASGFSVPVTLSISHGADLAELRPNQTLSAGQCLFAYVVSVDDESPGRIDATLEIERDATIH